MADCSVHDLHLQLLHLPLESLFLLFLQFLSDVTRLRAEVQHSIVMILGLFNVKLFSFNYVTLGMEMICDCCFQSRKLCLLRFSLDFLVPIDRDFAQPAIFEAKFVGL